VSEAAAVALAIELERWSKVKLRFEIDDQVSWRQSGAAVKAGMLVGHRLRVDSSATTVRKKYPFIYVLSKSILAAHHCDDLTCCLVVVCFCRSLKKGKSLEKEWFRN
jgi:hypothetical protein